MGDTLKSVGKVLPFNEVQKEFLLELWVIDFDENKVAKGSAKIKIFA